MNKKSNEKKTSNKNSVNEVITLSSKILRLFYIVMIIGIVFIATLLVKEWGILKFILTILKIASPLFIGFVIAWLFSPLVKKLNDKGVHKVLGSVIVYVVFLLILYLFISTLIPTVYKQLLELVNVIPDLVDNGKNFINNIFDSIGNNSLIDGENVKNNLIVSIEAYGTSIMENLPNTILNVIGSIFSGIGTFLMSLVIGFYMLFDFDSITSHFLKMLPKRHRFEINMLINNIGIELRKIVNGTFLVASMVFVGSSLGFVAIGLEAPLLFGLFCGITDLIPYIGPFLGGAAAVVVGFSQGPLIGILALIVVVVVQQLENLVFQPIVMSKTAKLHPVTIIIGLLIFGHFFGIIGMIFATPVISVLKILFRFFVEKFELFEYDEYEYDFDEKK